MDDLVSTAEAVGFSGQVLVAVGGQPVLHKAYGFADGAGRRPMELNTPIGIASMSKQFTAAMVLELEAQGLLSLDDSLPTFFEDVPEEKRGITLRQLVAHTSGLRSRYSEDFEPATRELLIRGILDTPASFTPGERWRYSAAGYNLLAAVVERVADRPYEEAVLRTLMEPAAMRSTGFLSALPAGGPEVSHVYMAWDDRGSPANWPRNWRNLGAGDMVSTAADLFRWELALRRGSVLSEAARNLMFEPLAAIGDGNSYGFGLFLASGPDGSRVIEHGGDAALGFNGSFFRYPDTDVVIVITCNARTPDGRFLRHAIGEGLEALAHDRATEIPSAVRVPSRDMIDNLTGSYQLEGGGRLHVLTDGAHLWLAAGDPAGAVLLGGHDPEEAADFARGEDRTAALLRGLLAGDSSAYHAALTEDGMVQFPSYWREWAALVESRGPFFAFSILGSHFLGTDVATRARLRFFQGSVPVTYFWQDRARGRLVSTYVGGTDFWPTVALSLAEVADGSGETGSMLAGRDPVRGTTVLEVRIPRSNDGLVRLSLRTAGRDVVAVKSGVAGWVPPVR